MTGVTKNDRFFCHDSSGELVVGENNLIFSDFSISLLMGEGGMNKFRRSSLLLWFFLQWTENSSDLLNGIIMNNRAMPGRYRGGSFCQTMKEFK